MKQSDLDRFAKILHEKRRTLLVNARASFEEDYQLDTNELPDEMDQASTESIQSFRLRLRGRERTFLSKIEKALEKIEAREFGVCDECGEPISLKRLEARPETLFCIRCKEDQERVERDFG